MSAPAPPDRRLRDTSTGQPRRVRICLVTEALGGGTPAAITARSLVRALAPDHELAVLAADPGPAGLHGADVRRGVGPTEASAHLRDLRPDVVHVLDPRALGTLALAGVRRSGARTIVSHHTLTPVSLPGRLRSGVDRTLVTSPAARREATTLGLAAHLWRPGVDADLLSPAARDEDLHDRWSRGGALVVVHPGPVDRPRIRRRLERVARVPGVRLVVLGGGAEADRLRSRAPGTVVLPPADGLGTARVLASADLVVEVRRRQSDAHALRAALACGVPVVGPERAGVPDLLQHRRTGLVVEPEVVPEAVARLVSDRELLSSLAGQARPSVAVRTWQVAATELVERHLAPVVRGASGVPA
ncbi:glycosyltransferase family 1 protein [Alteromonas gracilis]